MKNILINSKPLLIKFHAPFHTSFIFTKDLSIHDDASCDENVSLWINALAFIIFSIQWKLGLWNTGETRIDRIRLYQFIQNIVWLSLQCSDSVMLNSSNKFDMIISFIETCEYSNLDSRALFLYTPTGSPQSRSQECGKRS